MNALEQHIIDAGLCPIAAMNVLQDHGIVSDNAVWAGDVAAADHERAIAFLKTQDVDKR
jgi:hypothetical protein